MLVDQDAHPPHHLPFRSRHGSRTACHDRQALEPPWAPLAHAFAHSRSDGHQAQPEGLETIPSRSAQCWHLPREARSRLERSVEAFIGHVSRAAGCHMPGSDLAATARDQTSGGGAKYGKVGLRCEVSAPIPKKRSCQPRFCTVGRERPNLSTLTSHPCTGRILGYRNIARARHSRAAMPMVARTRAKALCRTWLHKQRAQ